MSQIVEEVEPELKQALLDLIRGVCKHFYVDPECELRGDQCLYDCLREGH